MKDLLSLAIHGINYLYQLSIHGFKYLYEHLLDFHTGIYVRHKFCFSKADRLSNFIWSCLSSFSICFASSIASTIMRSSEKRRPFNFLLSPNLFNVVLSPVGYQLFYDCPILVFVYTYVFQEQCKPLRWYNACNYVQFDDSKDRSSLIWVKSIIVVQLCR